MGEYYMNKLIKQIEKFNSGRGYINNLSCTNFITSYDECRELENMLYSIGNYEQLLFDKYGYDYDKDNENLFISSEFEKFMKGGG